MGLHDYLKAARDLLITGGEIISVDYGNDAFLTNQHLRIAHAAKANDPRAIFKDMSHQDITHDVNFTILAEEGMKLGLLPIFFGNQGKMILRDQDAISAEEKTEFLRRSALGTFHVLVQRKTSEPDETTLGTRFVDASLPVTHSQLFRGKFRDVMLPQYRQRLAGKSKAICTPEKTQGFDQKAIAAYRKAVDNGDYALALRTACSIGSQAHIVLILSYAKKIGFDINQVSKTKNMTALDWLQKTNIPELEKESLLQQLKHHGAKSFAELQVRMQAQR